MKPVRVVLGLVILVGAAIAASGVKAAWRSTSASAQSPVMTEIAQPSGWVPFSADIVITQAGDARRVVGKFFRRSDGSTRRETGPSDNPTLRVVNIKNVAISTFMAYVPALEPVWVVHPMELPPAGLTPPRMRKEMRGLAEHPEGVQGYKVYRYVDAGGHLELIAPDLNFYPLVSQGSQGKREVTENIRLGEPSNELFEVPDGASVRHDPKPMGIVKLRPEAKQ